LSESDSWRIGVAVKQASVWFNRTSGFKPVKKKGPLFSGGLFLALMTDPFNRESQIQGFNENRRFECQVHRGALGAL
jgi:hypothetical protein